MSTRFDVDFSEALRQLAEFQLRMSNMGHALDNMEKKSNKPATAARRLLKDVSDQFDKLEGKLKQAGAATEELGAVTQSARMSVAGMLSKIAAENLKLTVQTKAYSGELKEVDRLLSDSSAKSSFIKWSEKARNLGNELTNQNKFLATSLKALDTAEGQHNEVLKATLAVKRSLVTQGVRQQAENLKLQLSEQQLTTAVGKAAEVRKAKLSADKQVITEATRLNAKLGQTRRAYEGLQGGIQAQIAVQNALNAGMSQAATFQEREQNTVNELRRRYESLTGGLAEQAAQLRVLNAAREKQVTELSREQAKIEQLTRALTSLNGGEQEQIAKLQAKIAARRRAIQADTEAIQKIEELTAAAARELVAEQRLKTALEARNKATLEEARALQQMSKAEAESIAKAEALVAANKRVSESMLDEARKAHGLSKAQKELTQAREREIERLERLKAQKDLLNSSYGRELAAVQRQIQEQQRYNKLLTMTTAELLGFSSAQAKANQSMVVGSQSAAMMRAALSGLHTNIGMYTSGTIIAASSTYALASALRSTVEIGSEFTASMARSNAIMNGNQPFWMTDTGSMKAMEMQVRALGQSTIYTASEVAGGLTELGMAGLSAGDAVVALRPALDLATIGGVSMAQSADIATNVMMTFGLEAKNLGEVVDVMATAVVSSNTNIEQLANALTYAGPAAHTAGISMRDTVAAVEALANSGIKASRAGTALRRLFVSILNPTAKGSEMMTKYGISVVDAEGKTRGLVDIIQQLSKALKDVPGGERLGAIQDLVGVYATSPIAALVDQADNLASLRQELDDVAGAAERMRDKISDGLKYDWKEVISSFEEVKLVAFDSVEMRLRNATASLSKMLIDLTMPLKEGDSLTKLDVLIQKAEIFGTTLAWALGGLAVSKLAGGAGGLFTSIAADLSEAGLRAKALGDDMQTATAQTSVWGAAKSSAQVRLAALRTTIASTSGALGYSVLAIRGATTALNGLAIAASAVMRALGWVGLIYGIGTALATVFGSDAEAAARAQKEGVDALRESYDELKKSIQETALAKERTALGNQIKAEEGSIQQAQERKLRLPTLIEEGKRQGLPTDLLEGELSRIDSKIARYQKNIDNAKQSLDQLKTTESDRLSLLQQQEEQILAVKDAEAAYLAEIAKSVRGNNYVENTGEIARLKKVWDDAKKAVVETDEAAKSVEKRMVSLAEIADADLMNQESAAAAAAYEKQATAAEKLINLQNERAVVQAKINELVQADEKAIREGGDRPGQDTLNRLLKERAELMEREVELAHAAKEESGSLADAQRALSDFNKTELEQLKDLELQLEAVNAQKAEYLLLKGTSHEGLYEGLEAERLQEELKLLQQIRQLKEGTRRNSRGKSEGERAADKAKRDAEAALNAAKSTFSALQKEFEPLVVAQKELADKTAQLKLLQEKGEISAEQYAAALGKLVSAHHEATRAQDKNYQSLLQLKEAYNQESPFAVAVNDLAELNRLMESGAVSMQEYLRLRQRMGERDTEATLNGLPEVPTNLGDASASPFSDWMSMEIERAQGFGTYSKRSDDLTMGWQTDVTSINDEFMAKQAAMDAALEAEAMKQAEHDARMIALREDRDNKLKAAHERFNSQSATLEDSRLAYSEQMGQMVAISMLGSLENVLGMVAAVGEDATTAQKAAFVAQKALAIAQIIMYTHLAAARAPAEAGPIFGMPLASAIMAQGYASAGLVGALAIGQLTGATGSSGGGGGGSYAGAYDKGGNIPYGQWGIVGEYGPEIVQGPAHVTGREATARQLGGGGDSYEITLAPQIIVQGGGGGEGSADAQGKLLGEAIKKYITDFLVAQTRPNGMLDTWIRNRRN